MCQTRVKIGGPHLHEIRQRGSAPHGPVEQACRIPQLALQGDRAELRKGVREQARRLAKHEAGRRRVAEGAESALERLAELCKGRRGMQGLAQLPAWLPTQVAPLEDAPQCCRAGAKASNKCSCRKQSPSLHSDCADFILNSS